MSEGEGEERGRERKGRRGGEIKRGVGETAEKGRKRMIDVRERERAVVFIVEMRQGSKTVQCEVYLFC